MNLVLSDFVFDRITEHARSAYPEECCGLLVGEVPPEFCEKSGVLRISESRPMGNTWQSSQKARRYQLDPLTFARMESEFHGTSRGVIGIYHSHPDVAAWPSPFDLEQAWPCYAYLIVSVKQGTIADARVWGLSEDRRSFWEGVLDQGHGQVAENGGTNESQGSPAYRAETVR